MEEPPTTLLNQCTRYYPLVFAHKVRGWPLPVRILSLFLLLESLTIAYLSTSLRHNSQQRAAPFAAELSEDREGVFPYHALPSYLSRTSPCTAHSPCNVMIIADLDTNSRQTKSPQDTSGTGVYKSLLLTGKLKEDRMGSGFSVDWDATPKEVLGKYSEGDRGMELSELIAHMGRLLTFDDRTGMIYELMGKSTSAAAAQGLRGASHKHAVKTRTVNPLMAYTDFADIDVQAIPRGILTEGDGESAKGMKIEWATVKDKELIVGSFGKEYTSGDGTTIISNSSLWVAVMNGDSGIERHNWEMNYNFLRLKQHVQFPGYMIHEAVNWSPLHDRWFFLPRRVSSEPYDEVLDEKRGANLILSVSEDFSDMTSVPVNFGSSARERGFSSFKFLPGHDQQTIIALRSEENAIANTQKSYLSIFDLTGRVLMDEQEIPVDAKFEGIEIF